MAETAPSPNGLQKAAALILGLGVDNSSRVLQYLGEDELVRVMAALNNLGSLPTTSRQVALFEAHSLLTSGDSAVIGGGKYIQQLLSRSMGPRRSAEILERISAQQHVSSFETLRATDPAQVANLLSEEHPQTIALVISYLEPKLSAEILSEFPRELQVDITLRLASMDRVSPQVVEVVERGLKNKLSGLINFTGYRETGGVAFLVKILNQVDRDIQKALFEALEPIDPQMVDEIRGSMFTFDDLANLNDRIIQRILRDVNKQDLPLALKGAPEALREVIYRNLSERARDSLKEEIELLGPQLAKNVYAAQRRIVEVVRVLDESEEIVISSGGEGNEIID